MKKITLTVLLSAAIILFVNLVSNEYFFRVDFTEDKQYTLSHATLDMLKSLENPVTVTAYFSENLPPNIGGVKKYLEEMLIEYKQLSGDNVVYKFINPNKDEKTEQEALREGVQPVMINVREKDQMKQQKAFLGAVLKLGNQKEIIPIVQPGAALEYELSSSIKKMIVKDKPDIGFLQGHGEPSLAEINQAVEALSILYDVKPLSLNDSTPIPAGYKTIFILRPTDSVPKAQLSKLDAFLNQGGNLFVALNEVDGDFQNMMGRATHSNVADWLKSKGVTVESSFVTDSNAGSVTVQQQQGLFTISSQVQFPFLPVISNFADHPVTKGLSGIVMKFISPVKFSAEASDSSVSFTPLAFSSGHSGLLPAPQYFDIQKQWTDADFPLQKQTVAGVVEKKLSDGKSYRITVIGDADFPINGPQGQAQPLAPDNVNLLVNAIDWMSDDTGLIDLRTKGVKYRPLEDVKDTTKTFLKYLNFLLPIVLLTLYGLIRSQINRNKRIKRMQENYE